MIRMIALALQGFLFLPQLWDTLFLYKMLAQKVICIINTLYTIRIICHVILSNKQNAFSPPFLFYTQILTLFLIHCSKTIMIRLTGIQLIVAYFCKEDGFLCPWNAPPRTPQQVGGAHFCTLPLLVTKPLWLLHPFFMYI